MSLSKYVKKRMFVYILVIIVCMETVTEIGLLSLYNNISMRSSYINIAKHYGENGYSTVALSTNAEVINDIGDLTIVEMYPDDMEILFDDEKYKGLSSDEKLHKLQKVVNYSLSQLGIYEHIYISIEEGLNKNILGFKKNDNTVHLNGELFESSGAWCVYTCFHEVYHIYQYYVCDTYERLKLSKEDSNLKIYSDVRQWKCEFERYISGIDCYSDYERQSVEKTANEYALKMTAEIIDGLSSKKN